MSQSPLFRRFAAALAACALLAACGGGEEPAPDPQAREADPALQAQAGAPPAAGGGRLAKEIAKLATTKILPCPAGFFTGTDTFTITTGADTTLNIPGGHALGIPAGAVPTGTQFVVTRAIADSAALDISVIPNTVQPDSVVYLTVNYAPCVPPSDTSPKTLFRDSAGHYEVVGTANKNKKVTGALDHFSTYIVGGN